MHTPLDKPRRFMRLNKVGTWRKGLCKMRVCLAMRSAIMTTGEQAIENENFSLLLGIELAPSVWMG